MTSKVQHRDDRNLISRMRLRAVPAALALAGVLVPGMIAMPSAQAQTFTALQSFDLTDGLGGDPISPRWATSFTTLHRFDGTDGDSPSAALVQATNGELYGTTGGGGANGGGTVFKITPSGTLITLYNFCSQPNCTDGGGPSGLVQATDGDLYGTTAGGGASSACDGGCGTVFKITPSGRLTTLHSFDQTDGIEPRGGLVQATNGDFYGTTLDGGVSCPVGLARCGTVFKITPGGRLTTLHSFSGTDGFTPFAGLVQATDGNLYGTTLTAGANCCGTVFKITPSGTLTTLHSFSGTDGAVPQAALIQAVDGNLYGTTGGGADSACETGLGCGTVFKINPSGKLTTLHSFDLKDGAGPYAALVQDTNGSFYSATNYGGNLSCSAPGATGCGTVFRLSVGLGPFVETLPSSGRVGALVRILGTDLTDVTCVMFNGVVARYKVVSKTLISTLVPAGANTGFVTVTTSGKTLKSNVKFRVP